MKADIGDRVGAIVSLKGDEAVMFGYGVYAGGDEIPPPGIIGPFNEYGITNPKILLDSGEIVWGCECWWGAEEKIRALVEGKAIRTVTGAEYRARFLPNGEQTENASD